MKIEIIVTVAVALYLLVAVPMYFLNEQSLAQCAEACSAEGFDQAISAAAGAKGLECRCLDSNTRLEKVVTIA